MKIVTLFCGFVRCGRIDLLRVGSFYSRLDFPGAPASVDWRWLESEDPTRVVCAETLDAAIIARGPYQLGNLVIG